MLSTILVYLNKTNLGKYAIIQTVSYMSVVVNL